MSEAVTRGPAQETEDAAEKPAGGRAAADWAGYLLGFSLGGFFDGILLHQILQWHHLLSAIASDDLRFQVAADGYFHALMYGVAAVALWLLLRSHRLGQSDGRRLWANLLIGFGLWHVIDGVLSHWVMGIHRIRMDSPNPLLWDLIWFVAFGVAPLASGALMRRSGESAPRRSARAPCLAALLALGAGAVALRPPADNRFTTVLFAPGMSASDAFSAVAAIDGRIAWTDRSGLLVVFDHTEAESAFALYGRGAILVSGSGVPAGCFGWTRI